MTDLTYKSTLLTYELDPDPADELMLSFFEAWGIDQGRPKQRNRRIQ